MRIQLFAALVMVGSLGATELYIDPVNYEGRVLPAHVKAIAAAVREVSGPKEGGASTLEIYFSFDARDGKGPMLMHLASAPVGPEGGRVTKHAHSKHVKVDLDVSVRRTRPDRILVEGTNLVTLWNQGESDTIRYAVESPLRPREIIVPNWSHRVTDGVDKGEIALIYVWR